MDSAEGGARPLDIVVYTSGLRITGEDPVGLSLGGAETAVVSMARVLARLGHRVTVFCRTDGARQAGGVSWCPEEALAPAMSAISAISAISAMPGRGWDVFLSARHHEVLLGAPVPAALVGMWHHDPPCDEVSALVRAALPQTSFSFFLSRFQLAEYERRIPGVAASAVLTSNGVDFAAVRRLLDAAMRGETSPPDRSGPRFVYGSRPSCGLELLLEEIWPRIRARYPQAELAVAGYDMSSLADRARLERAARERERHDALIRRRPGVHRVGHLLRRELWREALRCTAVLYPGNAPEVSCMIALEAQALGIPIVATAGYALTETIGFGDTLVPGAWGSREYVEGFLERVFRLVEEPDFHRRARQAGRLHVTPGSHSWEALGRRWSDLFRQRLASPELVPAAGAVGR